MSGELEGASDGAAKPDRIQINMRLTESERDWIRSEASRLEMTMSDYILKCAVYDRRDGGAEAPDPAALVPVWDELRAACGELATLREQAAYIRRDTRSFFARELSRRLMAMCDAVEREMVAALSAVGSAIGSARPRRR